MKKEEADDKMLSELKEALGFDSFMHEIDKWIIKDAQITVSGSKWDIKREKDQSLFFGMTSEQNSNFPLFFLGKLLTSKRLGCILRSFTNAKDDRTGWPIKEIRGYFIWIDENNPNGKLKFEHISARDLEKAMNNNSKTGEPLPPEKSIIYCGPNGEYLDDELQPILYR